MKLRKMILAALFAALTCAATLVITIPSPTGGYFNPGDCIILLGAVSLGPCYSMLAAGIGSALADLMAGYAVYVPATLVIKGLMGLVAAMLYAAITRGGHRFGRSLAGAVVSGAVAESIMAAGYFLFETILYGAGTALANALTTNLPQAAVALVAATALYVPLERTKLKLTGGHTYVT